MPVLLLSGCAGKPGFAPSSSPTSSTFVVHGTGTAAPFDEYELQDLRTLAESTGAPLKEVLAGQRGSNELGRLADALEAAPDSGFVMTGHDLEQPGTAYMTFTDRPTASVIARLEALPLDTTVTTGLPLSHAQLVLYSESLAGVLDHVPGVQFVSCGPTALGDAVEVRYAVTGSRPSARVLKEAALAATARWSAGGRLKVPVHFIVSEAGDGHHDLVAADAGSGA